jgi:hypothetical protein
MNNLPKSKAQKLNEIIKLYAGVDCDVTHSGDGTVSAKLYLNKLVVTTTDLANTEVLTITLPYGVRVYSARAITDTDVSGQTFVVKDGSTELVTLNTDDNDTEVGINHDFSKLDDITITAGSTVGDWDGTFIFDVNVNE